MIALLKQRGVDVVFHQHQRRTTDFRQGKQLGTNDHIATWKKPARPPWLDQQTYDCLPDTMEIRELRVKVTVRGFRPQYVTIVTTLDNATRYPKEAVGDLFRQRWHVELDLRALKVTMNMQDLRGTTPEMVRKEIWGHCLAYNLIRRAMAATAKQHHRQPRSLSFAGALQTVAGTISQVSTSDESTLRSLVKQKLESIASRKVGHRPNRVEPRAVKRRPKKQHLLMKPRKEARAELLRSAATVG